MYSREPYTTMSDNNANNNETPNSTTNITVQATDVKPDTRYLKLEILQLAAELESTAAQSTGSSVRIADVLLTADKLADFVFSEEPGPHD